MINTAERDLICENVSVSPAGELLFAGQSTLELAREYQTPLFIMDEDRIRERCRTYNEAMSRHFGRGKALYASKASSFKRLYEIMKEEGMGIDVVSCGEICTAVAAGFPMENAYFHSNNKTDEDIEYAFDHGVGCFVVDNEEELCSVDRLAGKRGIKQKILLRLTPGIDPHTYDAISTGKVDSKFGLAIETGQADHATALALSLANVELIGFHCHVGSQVFDSEIYVRSSEIMLTYIAGVKAKYGYEAKCLNLGGGYGVRYTENDPHVDIAANIEQLGAFIKEKTQMLGISMPEIMLEPGRSIVADAGATLYTVGTQKKIPGYKNYVSVDGGMYENLRHALYGAPYTVLPAYDMNAECDMTASVVGRCCESGDIIAEGIPLPSDVKRGDVLCCLTTGAYHHSMASNYNRLPRPAIVMLSGGKSYLAVRRETFEDIMERDI